MFDFLRSPKQWVIVNCLTEIARPLEKTPYLIGFTEDVDERIASEPFKSHLKLTMEPGNRLIAWLVNDYGEDASIAVNCAQGDAYELRPPNTYSISFRVGDGAGGLFILTTDHDFDFSKHRISTQPRDLYFARGWNVYMDGNACALELKNLKVRSLEDFTQVDVPLEIRQTASVRPIGLNHKQCQAFLLSEVRRIFATDHAGVSPSMANDAAKSAPSVPAKPSSQSPHAPAPAVEPVHATPASHAPKLAIDKGELTCPYCWLKFDYADLMHLAMHDDLRGDSLLGPDAQLRFLATNFNEKGQALDAMGIPCMDTACPHCRERLPIGFVDAPHHIISLVGNASAGKSYYLSVLAKVMGGACYRALNATWMDADPSCNAMLNDMRNRLFEAVSAEGGALNKTNIGDSMYLNVHRFGKQVLMPRPFVYQLIPRIANKKGLSVIFYDNAGEHFRPDIKIEDSPGALHTTAASGVMFLFDPLRNIDFRRFLGDSCDDPQVRMQMNDLQDVILAEMKARMQRVSNAVGAKPGEMPLAVIVGKFDAWQHKFGEPEAVIGPKGLNLAALERNSSKLRDLLLEVCPQIVINAEAFTNRVAYFPMSAFGHTPVVIADGRIAPDPNRIRPMHAEVPVLWNLLQFAPHLVPTHKD